MHHHIPAISACVHAHSDAVKGSLYKLLLREIIQFKTQVVFDVPLVLRLYVHFFQISKKAFSN